MNGTRLKVGVVGAGYFGTRHARVYAGMKAVDLAGIADTDAAAARKLAAQTGAKAWQRPDALLGQVDAVSITTPSRRHAEVTLPYIRAGIPVLIEKPIALDLRDATRIIRAAGKSGAPVLIGHVERFNSAVEALLESVDSPVFVESARLGRFSGRARDTDVVCDLLIHDLDLLLAIFAEQPRAVTAIGAPVFRDKVDMVSARFAYDGGAAASITASRVALKDKRNMHVFCERQGYFRLDFQAQALQRVPPPDPAAQPRAFVAQTIEKPDAPPPLEAELSHFADVAAGRARPRVTAEDGRNILKLALRVSRSIEATRRARVRRGR